MGEGFTEVARVDKKGGLRPKVVECLPSPVGRRGLVEYEGI